MRRVIPGHRAVFAKWQFDYCSSRVCAARCRPRVYLLSQAVLFSASCACGTWTAFMDCCKQIGSFVARADHAAFCGVCGISQDARKQNQQGRQPYIRRHAIGVCDHSHAGSDLACFCFCARKGRRLAVQAACQCRAGHKRLYGERARQIAHGQFVQYGPYRVFAVRKQAGRRCDRE